MPRLELPRVVITRPIQSVLNIPAASWGAILLADQAQFDCTGREMLYVRNPTGGPLDVILIATPDSYGQRIGSASPTIQAGGYNISGPFPVDGFINSIGKMNINVSGTGLLAVVIELPPGVPGLGV